mmetsp:Transcript_59322/g.140069  ORF Transcript_59322/g.140069 Transcript_59322/m.140069 type:complete len:123 (-) Transcript_59322:397-765(-)
MHWTGAFRLRPTIYEISASPIHAFPFLAPPWVDTSPDVVFASGAAMFFAQILVNTAIDEKKLEVVIYRRRFGAAESVWSKQWRLKDLARPSLDDVGREATPTTSTQNPKVEQPHDSSHKAEL